jgi:mutator protein MutT
MKLVSAGLIVDKEGKILIARRSSTEPLSGWYEFPGGKLEKGESAPQSLVRELKEELDINSKIIGHFADTIYKYETGEIKLFCYWVQTDNPKTTFKKRVHDDLVWVLPCNLKNYKVLPADISICLKMYLFYSDNGNKFPDYLLNKI